MPLIINLGQLASHKVQNPQLLRIKLRSIGIKHRQGRTLPSLLSPQIPALLLVRPRVTKVGHFLPTGVKETAAQKGNQTSPALLCHIEALPRIVLLKVALIPQIERNTLLETKNSLSIDPRPSPGNRISSPTDLGHNPRAKMATATDHRVVTGSNVGSHLVTQRVKIMLATCVIELVPIRVVDRLATETILEAEIRIAKVLAGAHHLAGKVTALSVVKITAIRENAPLLIRISFPSLDATFVPLFSITAPLLTGSFRNNRPLCSPPYNSRRLWNVHHYLAKPLKFALLVTVHYLFKWLMIQMF